MIPAVKNIAKHHEVAITKTPVELVVYDMVLLQKIYQGIEVSLNVGKSKNGFHPRLHTGLLGITGKLNRKFSR
mgnify:CR=1 FL=1